VFNPINPSLQYRVTMTGTGLIALMAYLFNEPALFWALVTIGSMELFLGMTYSPCALLYRLIERPLKLHQIETDYQLPPIPVLKINATILLALTSAVIIWPNTFQAALSLGLITAFALLSGTTGFCPIAILWALFNKKKPNASDCL